MLKTDIDEAVKRRAEGTSSTSNVTPAAVRVQLDRILAGGAFSRSERTRRFLTFLVERTLDGELDKPNEYVLAVEVFNRSRSFSPDSDPIVRVETGRLRKKLQAYYEGEGLHDPVLIEVPQRTYVPIFRARLPRAAHDTPVTPPDSGQVTAHSPQASAGTRQTPRGRLRSYLLSRKVVGAGAAVVLAIGLVVLLVIGALQSRAERRVGASAPESPSLAVLPFANLSPGEDQKYFCEGLTHELIEQFAQVKGLRVVSRTSSFAFEGKLDDVRRIGEQLNVGLVLEGSVRRVGDKLRVTTDLINTIDGFHVWTRTFDREVKDVFAVQQELARTIASTMWTDVSMEISADQRLRPSHQTPKPTAYQD